MFEKIKCREGCGACCIAPSITSPIPGMPEGKPANVPCVQLTQHYQCRIFDSPERPEVCSELMPAKDMCGEDRDQAISKIQFLESITSTSA